MSKVRVKFLKHVASPLGSWKPEEIAELDEAFAKQICTPIKYTDRNEFFVKAIILDVKSEAKEGMAEVAIADLSVSEMQSLGIKNIVKTPPQPDHEKYLEEAGFVPSKKNDARRAKREERSKALTEQAAE